MINIYIIFVSYYFFFFIFSFFVLFYIGALLGKAPNLTEIDVSNNSIRGSGAAALTFGLVKSKSLLWCDLSWNALGKSPARQAARTLARSFKKNKM